MENTPKQFVSRIIALLTSPLREKLIPWINISVTIFVAILAAVISCNVGRASVDVMEAANTIVNTTNILALDNAIKQRMDFLSSIRLEIDEYKYKEKIKAFEEQDKIKYASLILKQEDAVTALLNIVELACLLYLDNKIDKKLFISYYSEIIKDYGNNEMYNEYIKPKADADQEPYSAIRKVYQELTQP